MSDNMAEGWRQKAVLEEQKAMAEGIRAGCFQNAFRLAVEMLSDAQREVLAAKLDADGRVDIPVAPIFAETAMLGLVEESIDLAAFIRGLPKRNDP